MTGRFMTKARWVYLARIPGWIAAPEWIVREARNSCDRDGGEVYSDSGYVRSEDSDEDLEYDSDVSISDDERHLRAIRRVKMTESN